MAARTGTLETCRDASGRKYFRGKVRLQDGSRSRVEIPEPKCYSETASRNHLEWAQEVEDTTHAIYKAKVAALARRQANIAGAAGESCDAWYERFKAYRRQEVGSVDDDARRWSKWIAPHIGAKPIRTVTADDIENIRDALNAAVLAYEASGNVKGEGRLAPKTAQNIWTTLTTAMKYASTRKGPRELRVREPEGNPCRDMPPPRNGASKRRHWLRPHQFVRFIAWLVLHDIAWAEAIAIGLYLHLRPGELHELRVKDLDLVAGEVRIRRAYDEREKVVKMPKTDEGIRTVTIPPTLLPLLERIARDGGAEDRVCPIVAALHEEARPKLLRKYLQEAGIDEPSFYVASATHIVIDFRSLRDSGITWRFLAGERVEVVQREAGHEKIETTLGYAKEVQDRRGRFGEPFPPLPSALIGPPAPSTPAAPVHLPVHPAAIFNEFAEAHGNRTRVAPQERVVTRSEAELNPPADTRNHASSRSDTSPGPDSGPLERELRRARAEGRWQDADAIASEIEARAKVTPIEAARRQAKR